MQKAARKLLAKHLLLRVHAAKLLCDAATFSRDIDELRAAAAAVRALPTSYQWGVATVALLQRVEVEVHILKTVERLLPQDAEVVFSELSSALHDADDLGDEFGALHASTLQQARDKVAMVGMRKQARSDLKQIIDGEALRHGLQLATKSQMWDPSRGPNSAVSAVDVEAISIAIVALSRIEEEEEARRRLLSIHTIIHPQRTYNVSKRSWGLAGGVVGPDYASSSQCSLNQNANFPSSFLKPSWPPWTDPL